MSATHGILDPAWRDAWATFLFSLVRESNSRVFCLVCWSLDGSREDRPTPWPTALVIGAAAFACLVAVVIPPKLGVTLPMQYGVVFAIFALGLSKWQPILLVNSLICWIGKVELLGIPYSFS